MRIGGAERTDDARVGRSASDCSRRPEPWVRSMPVTRRQSQESGQGLAEYALILALIAIVAIVALIFLGSQISLILSRIGVSI